MSIQGKMLRRIVGCRETEINRMGWWWERVIAGLVARGEAVPICFGQVYALVADARDEKAVARVREIKKRGKDKPFAMLAASHTTSLMADLDRVHKDLHKWFAPALIEKHFGAKGFMRFPIKTDWGLAEGLIGPENLVQTFTFAGDPVAHRLEEILRVALKRKHPRGYGEILCTSFNISGRPSITERGAAVELARGSKLAVVVHRGNEPKQGSYSIYRFSETVEKLRHGTGSDEIDPHLNLR